MKIGIIGIWGAYGQWLQQFCESLGHEVLGSDLGTELSNEEVVQAADVVIFTVPIHCTVDVVASLLEFSRPEQLWMDVTSVKQGPVEAMLKSRAEVVGLHPMCAPTAPTLKGQVMVLCEARLEHWRDFVEKFAQASEARIRRMSPEEHDRMMAFIQVLPHASVLSMAATLREDGIEVQDMLESTSAFYRIVWSLMGRILAQNAELYADIQMNNPRTVQVLKDLEGQLRALRKRVERGDRASFVEEFNASAQHFGEKGLRGGYELFEQLIAHLSRP